MKRRVRVWLGITSLQLRQLQHGAEHVVLRGKAGEMALQIHELSDQVKEESLHVGTAVDAAKRELLDLVGNTGELGRKQLDGLITQEQVRHFERKEADLRRGAQVAELGEKVDRLLLLLEPAAKKLHTPARPVVGDWDQVVKENLAEFEENTDGKSVRR